MVPTNLETAEARTMKPYQAYIALKQYPLWRTVQITLREPRVGLGTGFASFVASDKGQRIVLKSGLVPATAPVRIIELTN
jgi:phosphate transport system substrate-binding protein